MNTIIFLIIAFALYALWLPTIKFGLKRLSCTRAFTRTVVFEGEEGEMVEVVRNDGPCIIPWLRLESRISPYLRLGKQTNLDVNGETHYCSVFTPMPYQQIRRTHKVAFLRRGIYDLGNATFTAGDILGVYRTYLFQNLSAGVTVYPRLLEEEHLPSLSTLLLGEQANRTQLMRDPFLIRGIRPYMPGDPVRDIHWPATARTGQAQVRVHDYTTRTRLLVVINGQCEDVQWHNRVQEEMEQQIEYAISMAATLCVRALQDGLAAGFATNMPLGDEKESTVMLPGEGSARIEELLAAFARLNTTCAQKFPTFLRDLSNHSGLDILILSLYDSDTVQTGIAQLRQSGNRVALHVLEGGGV